MKAWSINAFQANGRLGTWSWKTAVNHPELGFELQSDGRHLWRWLDVQAGTNPLQVSECYERGSDLVSRYPADANRTFSCQLDHRCLEWQDPSLFVIEHWMSVQTHLLDSYPALSLGFREEMPMMARWGSCPDRLDLVPWSDAQDSRLAMVMGQVRSGASAAIMVHPLDCSEVTWEEDASTPLRLQFFGGFMEKGVIRRARLRCVVADRRLEEQELLDVFQDFANSPLPLTA